MRFHREGRMTLFIALCVLLPLNWMLHQYLQVPGFIHVSAHIISFVLLVIIIQFFRDPIRKTPEGEDMVFAPCDGKVVVIELTHEPEYFKDERRQISIFMNPFNVHVNRNPIGGDVMYSEYHPGKYLVAWHPKSSTENERTTVVVKHANGQQVLFRQIAGALARRVVKYVKKGDHVKAGAEMGFIKFGSRMDIFLPPDAEILTALEMKTVGGVTPIARLKKS